MPIKLARPGNTSPAISAPASQELLQAIHQIDPEQPIANVQSMEQIVRETFARQRFSTVLLVSFSLASLLLAAVGVYGVLAYLVAQRTREVGIRMALGAQKKDVLKLILIRGMLLAAWGTGMGLIGCYWLSRLVSNQLYGVSAHDPATLVTVAALLIVVALSASYIPARRATKVDPLAALRYE